MKLRDYLPPLVAQAGPDASTLAMVAVYPTREEAEALAVEGGLPADDLHCTLVFLGEADDLPGIDVLTGAVQQVASELAPIAGTVGGVGRFSEGPDGVPVLALPDVQGLTLLREQIVDALADVEVRSPSEHGFLPHMTLAYMAADEEIDLEVAEEKLGRPLTFGQVSVVVAGDRYDYELVGARTADAGPATPTPEELTALGQRVTGRLQADEHVGALAEAYQAVLEAAGRRMERAFTAQAIAVTAAGFVPPDEDEVVNSKRLLDEVGELADEAQQQAVDVLIAALDAEGVAYDVDAVFTDELLDRIATNTAFGFERELRATYRAVLEEASAEGWTVAEAAGALRDQVTGLAPHTARAIARTELNGLANGGSVHVATKTASPDEPLYKVWLATNDGRTRETHVDADRQAVLVNERFRVGDESLAYPGDPYGAAEEVINCRCTVIYSSTPTGTAVTAAPPLALPTSALARALPTAALVALEEGAVPAAHLDVWSTPWGQPNGDQLALMSMLAARAGDLAGLAAGLEALAAAVAVPQPPPVVHVHVPESQQLAPVVHVQVPEPVVQLAEGQPAVVQVDVHVPEQPAPVVNVELPEPPLRRIEFERDGRGRIEAAEEVS